MSDLLTYTSWLYTKIYQNEYFFFDLWSLVHFWNGFMLFFLVSSTKTRSPFTSLLIILFVYEVLEILAAYFALGVFRPETFKDQFTDIFVGLAGSGLGLFIFRNTSLKIPFQVNRLNIFIIMIASITYGFLWVGFYGYSYNVNFFNSPGINWYAWMLWTLFQFMIIYSFEYVRIKNLIVRFFLIWSIYIIVLFTFEALGYYILNLREVSNPNATPLILGIIHGSPVMHFMYLLSPLFSITLFRFLRFIIFRPLKNRHTEPSLPRMYPQHLTFLAGRSSLRNKRL